jgi:Predicted membrane protein
MDYLHLFLDSFIILFEIVGAIMIIYGGLRGAVGVFQIELLKNPAFSYNYIRRDFTNKLIFGLEFIIAADLLATIIAPSIEDVMLLGAIVAIRTVLSYFLSKETQEYPLEDN